MRLTLAFPPRVAPAHAPLGLAALAAAVAREAPEASLRCIDLDLEAWERCLLATPGGPEAVRFYRGVEGDFLSEADHDQAARTLAAAKRRLLELEQDARRHLESGETTEALARLLDDQLAALLADDPERVGLSLLSLDQLPFALALARRCRRAGGPPLVLGGAALGAIEVEDLLDACGFLDGVVVGEGEAAAVALARGEPVPGLRRTPRGSLDAAPPIRGRSPGALAPPDFRQHPLGRYLTPEPVLPLAGSRGCRWRRCRFCAHNTTFEAYRRKEAASLVDEIEVQIARHGACHVYFTDQYVDARALDLLSRELLRRGLSVSFHVMGRPTADCTREVLERASAAGCRWISWGVETGSQRLLDLAAKGCRVEDMERVLRDASAAGISNLPMMIFGLPGSTPRDLEETLGFLDRIHPFIDAATASRFVLYRTTAFGARPEAYGLEVIGVEDAVRAGGKAVRSTKLRFRREGESQEGESPLAGEEVERWERHRDWLGARGLLQRVATEHYLLLASRRGRSPVGRGAGYAA